MPTPLSQVDEEFIRTMYGWEEELTEENFYVPAEAEYEDFGEETEEVEVASLWENIRKKKEREGKDYKPAKKGDKDRPDPEAWKKAQSKKPCACGDTKEEAESCGCKGKGAEYQGRKVQLGKPFRTSKGPKKFSVYVKNPKGNVVKVNFGDPNMKIKKNNPARRKSFRARHNCDNPGPKHKARYWSSENGSAIIKEKCYV
jgi:hypothetical protein